MRVLLAEDETRVAGFIAKGLREQTYAVDVARDGEEAVYYAGVNQYDLVILDVQGFPLKRQWYIVHLRGRRLSLAADALRQLLLQSRDGTR